MSDDEAPKVILSSIGELTDNERFVKPEEKTVTRNNITKALPTEQKPVSNEKADNVKKIFLRPLENTGNDRAPPAAALGLQRKLRGADARRDSEADRKTDRICLQREEFCKLLFTNVRFAV